MTNRERFRRVLSFQPVDRLPVIEWAGWWTKTLDRWYNEGLPGELQDTDSIRAYFGLDAIRQCGIAAQRASCPLPTGHGQPILSDEDGYSAIRPHLFPDKPFDENVVRKWAELQANGEIAVWVSVEGFFWFPRTLFGVEQHLYAFYDCPKLMHTINEELLAFNTRALDQFCEICIPDLVTFAEDMSYNHGSMLSKPQFDEFVGPYYRKMIPALREKAIVSMVDSDGDIGQLIDWFAELGIGGFLPLERAARVDITAIRSKYPKLRMIGGFDKTMMHQGEERVREEFERLLPVMRQGGYVPSVDHQTPPEVSFDQYLTYIRILREYCERACS